MLPTEVSAKAEATLQSFALSLDTVRQHRNRRLMHFDFQTAMDNKALPRLLTDDLEAVVEGIGKVMSDISLEVTSAHQAYEHIIIGNAEGALEWMIADSIRYRRLREVASQNVVSDAALRQMVRDRGGRHDPQQAGAQ